MTTALSKRRSSRHTTATKRARSLVRDGVKAASQLTMDVLKSGRSPLAAKRSGPATRPTGDKITAAKTGTGAVSRTARAVAPVGLEANVSGKLANAAPAFGDVLRSFGDALAVGDLALATTALESLQALARLQVNVPVLIEQTLDDDGKPTTVSITTVPYPVSSIFPPSIARIRSGTFRMDMKVQSFDATSGVRFNQNIASAGVSYSGHSFGFAVAMNNTNVNAQFSNMSDFSEGSVNVSMDIEPRPDFEIPKPLQYGIGANLVLRLKSITQMASTNPVGFNRDVVLSIKLVKTDGSVVDLSAGQYSVTVPPGLLLNTLTPGEIKITRFCETATEPYVLGTATVTLEQLSKQVSFYS